MTEHMVSMGGTAVAEPPAPVFPTDFDESADTGSRRKLLIVGVAVAVLIAAVAGYFLTKGGSSATDSGFPVAHGKLPASSAKQHAGAVAKPIKLPKVFKGHVGRDPYKPLVTPPVVAPSKAPSAPTGSNATGSTGSTTSTTGSTGTSTSTGTTTGRHFHPVWIELVRTTGTRSATFVVGYSNGGSFVTKTFQNVDVPRAGSTVGTTFASQFALLSVQNGEATIQFGDGTPMDIAPGAANRLVVR